MKVLVIGGNRFVGLRLAMELDKDPNVDLHVVNRTGQVSHVKNATIFKGDRRNLAIPGLDKEWDAVVDFAAFDDVDAQSSINHFSKVGRYIFISTASVYDDGANCVETNFDPAAFKWSGPLPAQDPGLRYQEGKRRAEAVFVQENRFPVVCTRFPFILGPDDYTRRLEFHVERVEHSRTLYVPNPDARFSMIHSVDACNFLMWSLSQDFTGPLNVASPAPISMAALIGEIELRTGRKALYVQSPTPQNRSPYGRRGDAFLNCEFAAKLGFAARPIQEWLGELIDGARETPPPKVLH